LFNGAVLTISRYYFGICLERLRKLKKEKSVSTARNMAEIDPTTSCIQPLLMEKKQY
jgi:hypothetical protein